MAKKIHILFSFLTLGFFLMSSSGYACGKSSEKMSCEKKVTSNKETADSCQKECCEKKQESKKDPHGCNGKCDHSSCTPTALQFSMIAVNEFEFNSNLFNFSFEKTTPYYRNSSISAGFTSIWSPPKIK
ncbi:hypothetical protein BC749_108204 [Flavobacterium araucananum]|uniref:Lipoprotein n=1 Tax=Flavobacterium araucananum TaxID=946678 RepID=A0A227NIL8_9FLAO|nr:hypothetical protein [Flavobacterium araucananum]OXE97562.1 hypothetical protein B0A64_23305 [Flavobacterium araucananum]PWJ97054.1 hypothetical protein BC749_108204 [Flavobacterium araucananum]